MRGKTIGWHSDDVAEPSQLSLHDDVLHGVDAGSASRGISHTTNIITYVKFQVDCSSGLRATGAQNVMFPIHLGRQPYNSVMH